MSSALHLSTTFGDTMLTRVIGATAATIALTFAAAGCSSGSKNTEPLSKEAQANLADTQLQAQCDTYMETYKDLTKEAEEAAKNDDALESTLTSFEILEVSAKTVTDPRLREAADSVAQAWSGLADLMELAFEDPADIDFLELPEQYQADFFRLDSQMDASLETLIELCPNFEP